MHTGIHIGAKLDKDTLNPLTEAVLRILGARADQETIRAALAVISRAAEVSGCSVSGVHMVGEQHDHFHAAPDPIDDAEPDEADDATGATGPVGP